VGSALIPSPASVGLADYYQADILGVWYNSATFGVAKSPVSLNWRDRIRLGQDPAAFLAGGDHVMMLDGAALTLKLTCCICGTNPPAC
jgi:hypothetical protein